MNLRFPALVAGGLLLMAPSVKTQALSGTVVILGYSADKVFLVSDSRATFSTGKIDDSQCKIAALGHGLIFATTGLAGYDSTDSFVQAWKNTDEARAVFGEGRVRSEYGLVDTVTLYWAQRIKHHLTDLMKSQPLELLALMDRNGPIFSTGVFAGTDTDGNLAVRIVTASCLDRPQTPCTRAMIQMGTAVPTMRQDTLTPTDHIQIAAFGMPEIATEFAKPKKEFSASESKQWNSVPERNTVKDRDVRRGMKLIDLTLAYHPLRQYVGGKVDAVVLHRGGNRKWIRRKANCPAN